jgi:hypothetical protein
MDLHEKQKIEQFKVKLPLGTHFQMSAFENGNNKEYFIHVIAVMPLIELKGTAQDVKKAFEVLVEVRKELHPLLEFPDNKTETAKEESKKKLLEITKTLNTKRNFAITEALKAYKLFCCFVVGKAQTQWDKIVTEMHSKDPWIGVNGKSHRGLCVHSWLFFQDCIKLHKLTDFPADTAEKQHFYMQQTIKKPYQQVTVRQYMSCMGVLNDYLAYLSTVYDSSMAIEGMKKSNMLFDEADLAGIVLNLVPVIWVNQYNMMHLTLPKSPKALLPGLEAIERVMNKKHQASLKAKAKKASAASATDKGSSKKRSAPGNPGELLVPRKAKPGRFSQHCKNKGGPHLTHNTKECHRCDKDGNPIATAALKPSDAKKPFKKGGNK